MTDAGWFEDPTGRHEQRYWDGTKWTKHVADAGQQTVDHGIPEAPTGRADSESDRTQKRGAIEAPGPEIPQQPKAKKPWYRRPAPLIGVGFLVLLIIAAASGGDKKKGDSGDSGPTVTQGGSSQATTTTAAKKAAEKRRAAKAAEEKIAAKKKAEGCGYKATDDCTPHKGPHGVVQVDTIKWRVRGVEAASSISAGSYFAPEKADGVYLIVKLSARNGKYESITITSDIAQIEVDGKKYDYDSDGTTAANIDGQEPFVGEDVGPDVTVKGIMVFDVAKSALRKRPEIRFNELGYGSTHGYIRLGGL